MMVVNSITSAAALAAFREMQRLRTQRHYLELTQLEIAQHLGVARSTIATWETGRFSPSLEHFMGLCICLKARVAVTFPHRSY